MLMRVRESGDRIVIELTGVAGRQQSVLRALTDCLNERGRVEATRSSDDVWVRAGADAMKISLHPGLKLEPTQLYRSLRQALFAGSSVERQGPATVVPLG